MMKKKKSFVLSNKYAFFNKILFPVNALNTTLITYSEHYTVKISDQNSLNVFGNRLTVTVLYLWMKKWRRKIGEKIRKKKTEGKKREKGNKRNRQKNKHKEKDKGMRKGETKSKVDGDG